MGETIIYGFLIESEGCSYGYEDFMRMYIDDKIEIINECIEDFGMGNPSKRFCLLRIQDTPEITITTRIVTKKYAEGIIFAQDTLESFREDRGFEFYCVDYQGTIHEGLEPKYEEEN